MATIQPIPKEKLPIVRQLATEIWHKVYPTIISVEQIDYMLEKIYSVAALEKQMDEGQVFSLLLHDNQPIGYLAYQHNLGAKGRTKLHKLYLQPEFHGKNYGVLMLHYVLDACRQANQRFLFLNVNKYNLSYHFYKKRGFYIIEELVLDIGSGYVMDDYIMELPVSTF